MCVNQHNRKYCIFNTQYTKEEYEAYMGKMKFTGKNIHALRSTLDKMIAEHPKRYANIINCETLLVITCRIVKTVFIVLIYRKVKMHGIFGRASA